MSAELELARLERRILGARRVSSFLDQVEELRRLLAREDPRLRERVLLLVAPKIGRDLAAAAAVAFGIGIDDAVAIIGEDRPPKRLPAVPPKWILDEVKASEKRVADDVAKARALARAGADLATVVAPALAAANGAKRSVTTLVNAAGNAGTTAVADAAGIPTVWVAETNACVECLAYSGRVAKPGKAFPGGLTYGRKARERSPIAHPPRHPNCRCTVEPLVAAEYATALRREADRSVLRGFSLESESMKTRIDAAQRLVESDPNAPKSVIDYARRAVKAGEFPNRGRR